MEPKERIYRGFISYSHADADIANWLHKRLERYKAPIKNLDKDRRRLSPIFLDRDELPTSSDLGEKLRHALEQSESLIVICSPASAQSKWVNEEVRSFKTQHPDRHVLGLIVDGEPYAGDERECFPEAMRFQVAPDGRITERPAEPLAADIRAGKDVKFDALLKIAAGMLGTGLDELKQREKRRRRRQSFLIGGGFAMLMVAAGLAGQQIIERGNQARIEQARADAEARRARNEERNRIAALTHNTLETGTPDEALDILLTAIDDEAVADPASVPEPVLKALERVLNLVDGGLRVRQFESGISQINLLPDGSLYVRLDNDRLLVLDPRSGAVLREIAAYGYPKLSGRFLFQYTIEESLTEDSEVAYAYSLVRTDLQTGERLAREFETTAFYTFDPDFSSDGQFMTASCAETRECLAVVDWKAGEIVRQHVLNEDTGYGQKIKFLDDETVLHAYGEDETRRIAIWSNRDDTYQFEIGPDTQFRCNGVDVPAISGDVYFRHGWLAWGAAVSEGYCTRVWAPGGSANAEVVNLQSVSLIAPTDEGGVMYQTNDDFDVRWHLAPGDGSLTELSRCSGLDSFNVELLQSQESNALLLSNDAFTCKTYAGASLHTRAGKYSALGITGHASRITGSLLMKATNELLTAGSDGELRRMSVAPPSLTVAIGRTGPLVASETHIAFELEDGRFKVLDRDGQETAVSTPIDRSERRIYDFVADGRVLAVLDYDPIARIWNEDAPLDLDGKSATLTLIDPFSGAIIKQRDDLQLTSEIYRLDSYLTLSAEADRALVVLRDFQSVDEINLLDGTVLNAFRRDRPIQHIEPAYDDHSIWFAITYPPVSDYLHPVAVEQWFQGKLEVRESRQGYSPSLIASPDMPGVFVVMQEHWDVQDTFEHGLFFFRDDTITKVSDEDHMSSLLGVVHLEEDRLYDSEAYGGTLEMFDASDQSKSTVLPDLQSFEPGFFAKLGDATRKVVLTNSGLFWLSGADPIPICPGLSIDSTDIAASSPRSSHLILKRLGSSFAGALYDLDSCTIVMDFESRGLQANSGAVIQDDSFAWVATDDREIWSRIAFNVSATVLVEQAETIKSFRTRQDNTDQAPERAP